MFKLVERCNINCTYCYIFNGENEDWKLHPSYVKHETSDKIIQFLAHGCKELNISDVKIVFHGGEPLMYKKKAFDELCSSFNKELAPYTNLDFSLQTNAMLINEEWIKLFHKHNIKIGVSLDGPKEYNDVNRLDHKGRGTYDRVIKGLQSLQKAAERKLIDYPGILTVINPKTDSKKIYRHFVDDLKIKSMDFLLPDITHDTIERDRLDGGWQIADFGKYICNIFDEWIKDDNPEISIRIIDTILQFLLNGSFVFSHFGNVIDNMFTMTINSDGSLGADAVLTNTNAFNNIGNVFDISF
ncbi:radical SAM protein [Wolbachia endosymbiont of Pentidionis agamae]|uniref:radical SAM protein n=1 Tax=Wolbachia endosymbiont of Pentidionis agamae TaxID=3110435 RepID=UPI002FD1A2DD